MDESKITPNPLDATGKSANPHPKRRRDKKRRRPVTTASLTRAADGQPKRFGGRSPRVPDPADPAISNRQQRAFELRGQGATYHQIAETMGVSRDTIMVDVQMEGRRRANEFQSVREVSIAMSITRLESVIAKENSRHELLRQKAVKEERILDTSAPGGIRIDRTVVSVKAMAAAGLASRNVIAAVKEINMILGLRNVPDVPQRAQNADAPIIMFINALPADIRIEALRTLTAQAREMGVLPALAGAVPAR